MVSEQSNIRKQFMQGMEKGLDPDAFIVEEIQKADTNQTAVTHLRSRWFYQICDICGHNFRLGDTVQILPDGSVVHDMPGLRCVGDRVISQPEQHMTDRNEFYAGLEAAWPMPDEVPVKRLQADDPLLAPPRMGHGRAVCRVCGYTFREGDQVVLCPCHPDEPQCRAAVHRDLLRQLHCWDLWKRRQDEFRAKGKGDVCLGMS